MNLKNLISELKRRNVFKVATAYGIAGWLIIQIATSVFPVFNFPDWTSQFVIILVGIGFPISLIIAWAFELTAEGLKKTDEVKTEESITPQTGKKLNRIIITSLALLVIVLLGERIFFAGSLVEDTEPELHQASIAVLPFVNMSADQENEYFSDGLSEELLNGLAKIKDLQVAGRTSSFSFKGKNQDLRIIGEELGVKYILEGSVRKDGKTLRITAQLIQAEDGFHLWSETYDRELAGIFAIQEEISRNVINELKGRLLPEEEVQITVRPTEDIEAYNAYLEATQLEINLSVKGVAEAIEKYKEAIRLDPTFALAYARLAMAYRLSYNYSASNDYSDERRDEIADLMRTSIDQALLLDSDLGKAYEALGEYISFSSSADTDEEREEVYTRAITAFKKGVDMQPNDASARYRYYKGLRWKDYTEHNEVQSQTYQVLKEAYELDKLNPLVAQEYSQYLVDIEHEFEEGLKVMDQIIENYPDFMPIKVDKSWVMRDIPYGRPDEAFKYLFEAYKEEPNNFDYIEALGQIAMDMDMIAFAKDKLDELKEIAPEQYQFWYTYNLKRLILWGEGDYAGVEQLFEQNIQERMRQNEQRKREELESIFHFLYFQQGRNKDVIRIVEKQAPELFKPVPEVADSNLHFARSYVAVLISNGEKERAKIVADAICETVPESPKDLRDYAKIDQFYFAQIKCDIVSGRYEKAVSEIREAHFGLKSKANWIANFNITPEFKLLKEYEPYLELDKEVREDLHAMRANVIEFLKAEGEWKEEWEANNN